MFQLLCSTNLSKTVLVDDAPYFTYVFPNNTLKIKRFIGKFDDDELLKILNNLKFLSKINDVRIGLKKIKTI